MARAKYKQEEVFLKGIERDPKFDEVIIDDKDQDVLGEEFERNYIRDLKEKQEYFQSLIKQMRDFLQTWHEHKKPIQFSNFLKFIALRYASNQNCVILVDGRQGSGKSSFCFQLASIIDPTFPENAHRRKVNTGADFLARLYDVLKYIKVKKKNIFEYKCLVFDEARAGVGGGTFAASQEFREALDTMRKYKTTLIMNLPSRLKVGEEIFFDQTHLWFRCTRADHVQRKIYARVWVLAKIFTMTNTFSFNCLRMHYNGEWELNCRYCSNAIKGYRDRVGKNVIARCPLWIHGQKLKTDFCLDKIWRTVENNKDEYLYEKYKLSVLRTKAMTSLTTKNRLTTTDARWFNDEEEIPDPDSGVDILKNDFDDLLDDEDDDEEW